MFNIQSVEELGNGAARTLIVTFKCGCRWARVGSESSGHLTLCPDTTHVSPFHVMLSLIAIERGI
jgi:hypothetical protein